MKDSEEFTGVKITTICPGLVNTPLVEDKKTQFSFTEEKALTPDQVATGMISLLESKKYPCGTVLEISTAGLRDIPEWNIPPPKAEGTGQELVDDGAVKAMINPILATLNKERGA